jgi:hypothetical protein
MKNIIRESELFKKHSASQVPLLYQSWRKLCNKLLGILNRDRYLD